MYDVQYHLRNPASRRLERARVGSCNQTPRQDSETSIPLRAIYRQPKDQGKPDKVARIGAARNVLLVLAQIGVARQLPSGSAHAEQPSTESGEAPEAKANRGPWGRPSCLAWAGLPFATSDTAPAPVPGPSLVIPQLGPVSLEQRKRASRMLWASTVRPDVTS